MKMTSAKVAVVPEEVQRKLLCPAPIVAFYTERDERVMCAGRA